MSVLGLCQVLYKGKVYIIPGLFITKPITPYLQFYFGVRQKPVSLAKSVSQLESGIPLHIPSSSIGSGDLSADQMRLCQDVAITVIESWQFGSSVLCLMLAPLSRLLDLCGKVGLRLSTSS